MTIRVDSASLISGKTVVSLFAGHGIQAQDIPSTGGSGAGYLFNDIAAQSAAPTDEMRGQILTWPSAGTLTVNEDSSFSFTDAPDGSYSFTYRGFKNGVSYGDYTVTLSIGDSVFVSAANVTMPQMSLLSSGNVVAVGISASIAAQMPQMVSAALLDVDAPSVGCQVSLFMPQMTVSAIISLQTPTMQAACSFVMPQMSVYSISGEFDYFSSAGSHIETVAASTHLEYTL